MTDHSPRKHAYTAMQIYQALVPLGHAPVFEPDKRPDGPLEQDRTQLLGVLLSVVELALLTEPPETAVEFNEAYARQSVAGCDDHTNLAGMLAVRFSRMQMLLDAMGGGPIITAAARNAAATTGLLNLWLLGLTGRAIDTDDMAILRQLFKDALTNFESARNSFEDVRGQLVEHGLEL